MTDPKTLLTQAQCYICLGISIGEALQLALLAQVVANGSTGGGGGVVGSQIVAYLGASPVAPPPDPTKPAIAYSNDGSSAVFGWNVGAGIWN